ncbi:glycosyltransferase family 4 protein [Microtetraspora sp. AC03309]|uniref:glycosyltransferase family 4 protein n=1 Tax=Microtetraspora sp. AC03309 TaxID=2779376 RepID=UPI001E5A90A7|nr:glycosyltransferase family 4 protein [Microtetraspora sp. AC03309]MCC5577777.1 glycosyltransferase family 4 protein [Microtetraspora sp. AC03309]
MESRNELWRGRGALRIAMIAPPWYEVPPRGYGGIESMVADLVAGLVRRGHQVTLIGAGRGVDLRTYEQPPSQRIGDPMPEVLHAARVERMLEDLVVDVVHDHSLAGPLGAGSRAAPTVVTCHGTVTGEMGDYYRALDGNVALVAISSAQRARGSRLDWAGRVHNAVNVASFPFRDLKEDWVLWLGRFNPDKGAHLAIEAARAVGRRIVLAGKRSEEIEHAYFEAYVKPRLGQGVQYVGEADADLKRELLSKARCLLFPLQWEEPFGMTMIEAMACGTPVVALDRGAVAEIVVDGVTGFVRKELGELPPAIEASGDLDPALSRAHVARNFDVPAMVGGYERVYHQVAVPGRTPGSPRDLPLAQS